MSGPPGEINRAARICRIPERGGKCYRTDREERQISTAVRQAGLEVARALCVIGLVFLGFAATPAMAVPGANALGADDAAFCGGAPDDPDAHAPCHACRGGDLLLPPPPGFADPAFPAAVPCRDATTGLVPPAFPRLLPAARAPPAA